jgi:hypothetical protein
LAIGYRRSLGRRVPLFEPMMISRFFSLLRTMFPFRGVGFPVRCQQLMSRYTSKSIDYGGDHGAAGEFFPFVSRSNGKTGAGVPRSGESRPSPASRGCRRRNRDADCCGVCGIFRFARMFQTIGGAEGDRTPDLRIANTTEWVSFWRRTPPYLRYPPIIVDVCRPRPP